MNDEKKKKLQITNHMDNRRKTHQPHKEPFAIGGHFTFLLLVTSGLWLVHFKEKWFFHHLKSRKKTKENIYLKLLQTCK